MLQNLRGGVAYSVTFINKSSNAGNFCVFQKDPDLGVPNVMPLAWFSKYVREGEGQRVKFTWTIDYSYVWGETGQLQPGVIFDASQTVGADLSTENQITLNYEGGAYAFINQTAGPNQGSLYIKEDSTIPLKQASVGIGMSGQGTFAVQAQPNMNLTFTPHPQYWCVFGNYQQGEVMDIQQITNDANIKFAPGIYSMYAILNQDNTWTISSTAQVNNLFLAQKKKNAKLRLEDVEFRDKVLV